MEMERLRLAYVNRDIFCLHNFMLYWQKRSTFWDGGMAETQETRPSAHVTMRNLVALGQCPSPTCVTLQNLFVLGQYKRNYRDLPFKVTRGHQN